MRQAIFRFGQDSRGNGMVLNQRHRFLNAFYNRGAGVSAKRLQAPATRVEMRTAIYAGDFAGDIRGIFRSVLQRLCVVVALLLCRTAVCDDPPQLAIYSMNADGSELQKVVQAPNRRWHGGPSWSHDGTRILFHAFLKDATTPDSHVFAARADGTDIKDLGAGANANWSPDDKQIVFSIPDQHLDKEQAGVWIMNANGKGRQWIFAGTSPRYAPDGSRILFVSSHEGNQSIYVYDMIEGMPKKILQEPYQQRPGSAAWSPDGKRVAFVDERTGKFELILIDSAGSEKKQSIRHRGLIGGPVAWAPHNRIAIWLKTKEPTDPQRLHILDPDTEDAPVILSQQDSGKLNFDPAWSTDGQRLLFVSDRVLEKP